MVNTKGTLVNLFQIAKILFYFVLFYVWQMKSHWLLSQSVYNPTMISVVNISNLNVNQKIEEHDLNITTQESLGS